MVRTLLRSLVIVLFVLLAGCKTPWVPGDVVACLPQHTEKCHPDTAFFVEKTRDKRVSRRVESALRKRGFTVVERAVESDVIVKAAVDSHEYNDVGFAGPGPRDDMTLTVTIVDRRKQDVMGRWRVTLHSDFRILDRCVDKF